MTLRGAVFVALALATASAFAVARSRREYRPVLRLLAFAATANVIRPVLRAAFFPDLAAPSSLVGMAAVRADQALTLGWPAAIVLATLAVFAGRGKAAVMLVWAAAVALRCAGVLPGFASRAMFLFADVAGFAVAFGAGVTWSLQRRSPELHHIAMLIVILYDGATLLAYREIGGPWATWDIARIALLGMFSMLALIQGGALWFTKPKSS
jgi:hypothetical protein